MDYAIEARGLRKAFGDTQALDGVDLAARPGSVLGVLGPNGAGKTTAVRILATLLKADEGTAIVAGHDVAAEPARVREQIGLTGQYASVDELLTGRQNLELIGALLDLKRKDAKRRRAQELLEWFDLTDAARPPRPHLLAAACAAASTSPPASSAARASSSSTSPRPASTPPSARTCGASCATSSTTARRSC